MLARLTYSPWMPRWSGSTRGEVVTIPPVADEGLWIAYNEARLAMAPNLSQREVANRYRQTVAG